MFAGNNVMANDRNRRARDTAIDTCVCRWMALGMTCAVLFLGLEHVDMPFVRHNDKAECGRRLCDWLQKGTDGWILDLAC